MKYIRSHTEKAKKTAGTSRLQVMKAVENALVNLRPEAAWPSSNTSHNKSVTTYRTGLEAAAVVASRWTEIHETAEIKDKAAGPARQKNGLCKVYDVLKKEKKEYEDALGYNREARATGKNQSNWDKYANELKKRIPGHQKQIINYNGVTSNRKNWRLEKIGDSGTKPVI